MTKVLIIFYLIVFFAACNNQASEIKADNKIVSQTNNAANYTGLHGTWVRHNKNGFTLIEIKDTANVLYYQLTDRKVDIDTITTDRYWYYRSKGTIGYRDSVTIWISTDKFRFDYKVKGDTLMEFDKTGDQGMFIKVYTDAEKAL